MPCVNYSAVRCQNSPLATDLERVLGRITPMALRRVLFHVETIGDQAEHLGGLLGAVTFGPGVHGVLDDPDGDRGGASLVRGGFSYARYVPSASTFTGRSVELAEARHRMRAPVASTRGPGTRTGSSGPPAPASTGRRTAAGPAPASAPRYRTARRPPRQRLLPGTVPLEGRPVSARCRTRPSPTTAHVGDPRPGQAVDGRPRDAAFSSRAGTSVTDPSMEITRSRNSTPPAPRRRQPARPRGQTACRSGSVPSLSRARDSEDAPGCRHRWPALASTQPSGSSCPASRSAPRRRWHSPIRQLGHHLPVAAVPAPELPQCQHKVHDQMGRQQMAADLPGSRRLDHLIHQIRRERPGQHPDRDPVRHPAVRRQPSAPS